MGLKKKRGRKYLLLTIPFIIFIFAFAYVPLFGWVYSLYDYRPNLGLARAEFVGLKHYIHIFEDHNLPAVIRNTLAMSVLGVLCSPVSMFVAIGMNEISNSKIKRFIQTVTTLPNFISWVVVYGLAVVIFSHHGLWNDVLKIVGLEPIEFGLIGQRDTIWYTMQGFNLWKGTGWSCIIYLAAITGIDSELYDAAKVDGANRLQLIRYITLPGVLPTYVVMLLLSVGNILNAGFEQYYMFWNAAVSTHIETLDYYIYELAFKSSPQYSYSIALGIVKTLIGILLMFIVNAVSKKIRGNTII